MADTGITYPGTAATEAVSPEDDFDWADPNYIKADDNNYADGSLSIGTPISYRLKATNFGFSLPAGATIDGILVEIGRYEEHTALNVKDYRVQLLDADGNLAGDNKADTVNEWPLSEETASYGGSSDTWNASPTKAMVEDSDFGVVLSVNGSFSGYLSAFVDFIRMTIYYTAGWSGKVSGVSAPAKVMMVDKANINSVMGVS
jgi:hypothetical protein